VASGGPSVHQDWLLWGGLGLGSAVGITSGFLWLTRTQKYQDLRERGDATPDARRAQTVPVADELDSNARCATPAHVMAPNTDVGLPDLPAFYETTIQNGFGVIPHFYWARRVNGKAVLEIWFYAVNVTDNAIPVSLVSIPDFRVTTRPGSEPIVFEGEIQNAKTGLRIGPRRYKLIRITHQLSAERVEEFRQARTVTDNSASLTIAIDGVRPPLPYVISNLAIIGSIALSDARRDFAA